MNVLVKNLKKVVGGAVAVIALAAGGQASAAIAYTTNTANQVDIPGLTGFSTTGSMMNGMSVTATFSGGTSETLSWGTTGANSGGVFSSGGWSLTLGGDSFSTPWQFNLTAGSTLGSLTFLKLDGSTGFVVFDRSTPSPGTNGSSSGGDFVITAGLDHANSTIEVTYSSPIAVIPNGFVGDLWHALEVDFSDVPASTSFSFLQDTDNDSRLTQQVPEPGMLMLLGAALAGLGLVRSRQSN